MNNGTQNGLQNGLNLPGKRKASYSVYDESDVLLASGKIKTGKHKDIIVAAGGSAGWTPPDDLKTVVDNAFALIDDGDNGFIGLYLAFPNIDNYVAFRPYFSGTATVDFGDGSSPSSCTNGVVKEALLDYSNIPGSIIPSLGAKLAIIIFKATSDMPLIDIDEWHSTLGTKYVAGRNWFAIKGRTTASGYSHMRTGLERLLIMNIDKPITTGFNYPSNLKQLTWSGVAVASPNNWPASMFRFCNDLTGLYFSDYNLASLPWSDASDMSYSMQSTQSVFPMTFEADIDNCTTLLSAWQTSYAFNCIKLNNSGNVTSIQNAIYGSGVECFEMDDASGVITTTNFTRALAAYNNLKRLILTGLPVGIDISYAPMTATALDAFFTSLGTANGAQTITVIGCIGALTCDTSIATAKGYTVVTS